MNQHKAQLGNDGLKGTATVSVSNKELSVEEKLAVVETRLALMTRAFLASRLELKEIKEKMLNCIKPQSENRRGTIPTGTILYGTTKGKKCLLIVLGPNKMKVGNEEYPSLSAAAEAVSGVRRSGWAFWCTEDGKTAKEFFNK